MTELDCHEIDQVGGAMKESAWLYNVGSMLLGAGAAALLSGVASPAAPIIGAAGLAIIGGGAAAEMTGN